MATLKRSGEDDTQVLGSPPKRAKSLDHKNEVSSTNYEVEITDTADKTQSGDRATSEASNHKHEEQDDFEDFDELDETEDFDEFEEFDWLDSMYGYVQATPPSATSENRIASCVCKFIRRDHIRNAFHHQIEEPTRETSDMGFDLFDRYGRLNSAYQHHPIKKGAGIWGDELDSGAILLIEDIRVLKQYRRKGLGTMVVKKLLEKTRTKSGTFFAITRPAWYYAEIEHEITGVSEGKQREVRARELRNATAFWRSLGFRRIGSSAWFALASDTNHACHSLLPADDYDPRSRPPEKQDAEMETLFRDLEQSDDDVACLSKLQGFYQANQPDDIRWVSTDCQGDTILHVAAKSAKPGCVKWLVDQIPRLQQIRNDEEEVPVEGLLGHLERLRTRATRGFLTVPMSDAFRGFSDAFVSCLATLKGITNPQPAELLRLKYGCTCGQCVSGFLSPRMRDAVLCQAEMSRDSLSMDIGDGSQFVGFLNEGHFEFLPDNVRANFRTNKSMRQGFVNIFHHIATCLTNNVLPTTHNVLMSIRDEGEWPPVTRNYFERGGTVDAVGSVVFSLAMQQDKWAGQDPDELFDGMFGVKKEDSPLEQYLRERPVCRNDHEYGFVSGQCGFARVCAITYVPVRFA